VSTYREIVGKKIKKVSSDPSNGIDGQMWYNSTTGTLRGIALTQAWVSGPAMSEPRATSAGGGTNTSAITSGENGGNPGDAALAESYNGTGWSSETNVPTALGYTNGTGSSSEAYVQAGGGYPSRTGSVFDYDGSSWTSGTAVPGGSPGYIESGMCGPSADALFCGGNNGATTTWERGSGSWTAGGAMANGVYAPTLVGTQTAAISMGGVTYPGGYRDFNQDYNGTAWTSLTVLPAVRGYSGGAGIQTLSMMIGGNSPSSAVATCIEWDSSSWTSIPNLGTARNTMCPMGKTVGTAVAAPGNTAPAGTEEFNRSTNTITAAAWASSGALSTARLGSSSFGIQTSGVVAGGRVGPPGSTTATEEYNGATWGPGGALNTARQYSAGVGVLTAGLAFGGNVPPAGVVKTEEYNGTAWTQNPSPSGDMGTGRRALAGFGTQGSAVAAGGEPYSTATEDYNGSAWTAGNTLTTGRQYFAGAGASGSSGVVFGGTTPSVTAATEELTGESWTAGGPLITARGQCAGCGTQTAALAFGGYTTTAVGSTEGYDGTVWSTRPSMGSARYDVNGFGTQELAVAAGGDPLTTATEEFTAETTAVNVKTLTQS